MAAAAPPAPARTSGHGQTRQLLVDTAMRLFRDHGYEKTTMRAIALAAGVSVGNAYYYFQSKDELVREFYRRLQEEHHARCLPLLLEGQSLGEHLRAILLTGLEVMSPHHGFGSTFAAAALPPGPAAGRSGQGPAAARRLDVDLYRHAVQRSRPQPPLAIREDLPELLRLLHLGILLYWVRDGSPGQERTRRLVGHAAPLAAKLVVLARLPVVRKIAEEIARLVQGAKA